MAMPQAGPLQYAVPGEGELPPWLHHDHARWRQAKDEVSRQFAIANYRDQGPERDSVVTQPYGEEDDMWQQGAL